MTGHALAIGEGRSLLPCTASKKRAWIAGELARLESTRGGSSACSPERSRPQPRVDVSLAPSRARYSPHHVLVLKEPDDG